MKYKKFAIDNYKGIEHIEIPIKQRMIPLIGINESGKTSILQAILCFDKNKDGRNKSAHLNYENNYTIEQKECIIKVETVFEGMEEVEQIAKGMKLDPNEDLLYKNLKDYAKNKKPLVISRKLETRKYSVEDFQMADELNESLANHLFELLPYILYFDDFTDRVPESIPFTEKQLTGGFKPGAGVLDEWKSLVEEIFVRTTGRTLQNYYEIQNEDKREGVLYDVQDELNKQIIEAWNELKKSGSSNLADDKGELELKLKHVPQEEGAVNFEFKVIDKSHHDNKRLFSITDRSKGFQWFFNFIVKLRFNSKYQKVKSDAIYLLDEPGSYLHSTAQEELLLELKRISVTNNIIYCTHSQHLLNPDSINISDIKIVVKESDQDKKGKKGMSRIFLRNLSEARTINFEGALSPLYNALHLRIGTQKFSINKVIITEGITDYYFFKMLEKYTDLIKAKTITLIPGAGAGHLKELISFAIAWSKNYLILLDSDVAGKKAYGKYSKHFGDEQAKNFFKYCTDDLQDGILLESFFSQEEGKKLKAITKAGDIKLGIMVLFFSEDKIKEDYITNLDEETIANLKLVINRINEL
ncbi:MAG: AAA family ATPase [Bacteroidetes bacterium]|nr:AAA family ATPase [Bacteroidota bacterium]